MRPVSWEPKDLLIEIIRVETTFLPTGQQYLQWFYQKLEGSHQFYSASYMSLSIKLNHCSILFMGHFQKKNVGTSKEGKRMLFSSLSQLSN